MVYPQVYNFPAAGRAVVRNIEVVATKDETLATTEELQRRDRSRNIGIDLAAELISYRDDEPTGDVPLLTDGHAPVDSLLDSAVGRRYIAQRTNETEQRVADRNATSRSTVAGMAVRAAQAIAHDGIHAKEPTHDRDRWTEGAVESTIERGGHWVARACPAGGDRPADETIEHAGDGSVELVVTFAVRGLFLRRLNVDVGKSPVGCRLWYRKKRR